MFSNRLRDLLVAIERTGNYHTPVQRAFRRAQFETRVVPGYADLFGQHVNVPLEATYMESWRGVPVRWKRVIEGHDQE